MLERFIIKKFRPETMQTIDIANEIIDDYVSQGLTLTLRQLYYQFVSRDILGNNQKNYNKLGTTLSNARQAGFVNWEAIEDRGRSAHGLNSGWESPKDLLDTCRCAYKCEAWKTQPAHVEVWVEKEALVGVIELGCEQYRVPHLACKGYMSLSEMYVAGQRIREKIQEGKEVHILHLGDHDPSGLDMTRDIQDRLNLFGWSTECDCGVTPQITPGQLEVLSFADSHEGTDGYICDHCYSMSNQFSHEENSPINVHRIALNHDQVLKYNPPPNPAKLTDSRADSYIREFGRSSWELDALPPDVLINLIKSHVDDLIDHDAWKFAIHQESLDKNKMLDFIEQW